MHFQAIKIDRALKVQFYVLTSNALAYWCVVVL